MPDFTDPDAKKKEEEAKKRVTLRIVVAGEIRNVGYCEWLASSANRQYLSGWVRTTMQGSIEALIAGPKEKVEAMVNACYSGPPRARVKKVTIFHYNDSDPTGEFHILSQM